MNIEQSILFGVAQLDDGESPDIDTRILLCHVLQCNTARLMAWPEQNLSAAETKQFTDLVSQRKQGVPVAYLTGQREFWSLDIAVSNATLIPRPETELLVETVLQNFTAKQQIRLADLGTGSGAIAIAIASERPLWQICASDISADALEIAQNNARTHRLSNIHFIEGSWFEPLQDTQFDIIASNPPYIASSDPHLKQGDVRFEPVQALTSGITGMDAIEHLCQRAHQHLSPGGMLIFEHGYDQQQTVFDCLKTNGFKDITQYQDFAGHTRISAGYQ